MAKSYRIVITDDHKLLSNGVIDLLKILPEAIVIGTASSPEDLKQLLRNHDADILILDYRLGGPVKDTTDLIRWLIQHRPDLKIIMYSGDDVSKSFRTDFPKAIQGYVLKTDEPTELINAIKAVADGKTYRSESIKMQPDPVSSQKHRDEVDQARKLINSLSKREKEILIKIVNGLQNKEIAVELILAEATIKTHRRNLKAKLKAKTTLDLRDIAERGGLLE